MLEHWGASCVLYSVMILAVWMFGDFLCGTCGRVNCHFEKSLWFKVIVIGIAFVALLVDTLEMQSRFPYLDPDTFVHSYSNGTALGPEWREDLRFPGWLRFLVVFSGVPVIITAAIVLNDFVRHIRTPTRQATTPSTRSRRTYSQGFQSNPITYLFLMLSGTNQGDHVWMIKLMPAIYAFLSYNSIMRIMQLFTGAVNEDNVRYEGQPLSEKCTFVEFMVTGNDNAMAFYSAWALLNFGAYVMQGLRHGDRGNARNEMLQDILFQMVKLYILVNAVQVLFGVFLFFLFRENVRDHGFLSRDTLNFLTTHSRQYSLQAHDYIQGAGIIASMASWGSLGILSKNVVSRGFGTSQDGVEKFDIISSGDQGDLGKVSILGFTYDLKFLSIKLVVSVSFVQQSAVRCIGRVLGFPRMTHMLMAQCVTCYEAVLLAWIIKTAWPVCKRDGDLKESLLSP